MWAESDQHDPFRGPSRRCGAITHRAGHHGSERLAVLRREQGIHRYAPLDQIDGDNVGELRVLWRRAATDPAFTVAFPDRSVSGNLRSAPVLIGDALYAPNALGLVEAFHPSPAPLVTKTLLFIGDGGNVFGGVQRNMWGRGFRAYDKATGEVLWETELPTGVTGAPMT